MPTTDALIERITEAEAAVAAWHEAVDGDSGDDEHEAGNDLADVLDSWITDAKEVLTTT